MLRNGKVYDMSMNSIYEGDYHVSRALVGDTEIIQFKTGSRLYHCLALHYVGPDLIPVVQVLYISNINLS